MKANRAHYIPIVVLTIVLFSCLSRNLKDPSPVFDVWLHLAALRELIFHPNDILHPLFLTKTPQRDFAPFYFILSRLSGILGKDVFLTFKAGGILNFIFYSCFLAGFLERAFGFNSRMKATALLGTLFLWGSPWMWSAVYSFNTLTLTAGYPSFWGFALSIGSLYYLHGYLYQKRSRDLFSSIVLFFLFFITYPPVLPFFLVNAILITPRRYRQNGSKFTGKDDKTDFEKTTEIKILNYRISPKTILIIFLFSSTVLASFLWPLFSLKSTLINIEYAQYSAFEPIVRLKQLWPLLLAGYVVFLLPGNRLTGFCKKGFIIFILLACLTLPFSINLWGRFLLFSLFYIQIGFAAYISSEISIPRFSFSSNILLKKGLICFFLSVCCYQAVKIYKGNIFKMSIPVASYQKIGSLLGDRTVVLSDPVTGWPLPAFGPKIVAHLYKSGEVGDESQRRKDVKFFLSFPEKVNECFEVLSKYQARYILINKRLIRNFTKFHRFGDVVYSDDFLVLINVFAEGKHMRV